MDVVAVERGSGAAKWYRNRGNWTFSPQTIGLGLGTLSSVDAVDIDNGEIPGAGSGTGSLSALVTTEVL